MKKYKVMYKKLVILSVATTLGSINTFAAPSSGDGGRTEGSVTVVTCTSGDSSTRCGLDFQVTQDQEGRVLSANNSSCAVSNGTVTQIKTATDAAAGTYKYTYKTYELQANNQPFYTVGEITLNMADPQHSSWHLGTKDCTGDGDFYPVSCWFKGYQFATLTTVCTVEKR